MGLILGKISVETPKFQVLRSTDEYEVRHYAPSLVAQITYNPTDFKGDKDGGFPVLGNYIGVFGKPQNSKPEKIAMTTPVITKKSGEKISMTVPVVTRAGEEGAVTMQFTLPSEYKTMEEVPKPLDDRVEIKAEGERKCGVVKFSGVASDKVVNEKVAKLKEWLGRDGYVVAGEFLLARYNPPWSLPPLRKNEIMIPVE